MNKRIILIRRVYISIKMEYLCLLGYELDERELRMRGSTKTLTKKRNGIVYEVSYNFSNNTAYFR